MKIIERIYDLINSQNLRAKDLASYIDINQSVLSTWKKRNTNPPAEHIIKICEFLNVTPEFLLTGSDSICNNNKKIKTVSVFNAEDQEIIGLFHLLEREDQIHILNEMYQLKKNNSKINNNASTTESSHEEGFRTDQKKVI